MARQVEAAEEKLAKIKSEAINFKKVYSIDIQKLEILMTKMEYKKQSIENQQEQLSSQSNEYVEKTGKK